MTGTSITRMLTMSTRTFVAVSAVNPGGCTDPTSAGHDAGHSHGPACGHEPVPHGEHVDYMVEGRLHHPHEDHCDDHGALSLA